MQFRELYLYPEFSVSIGGEREALDYLLEHVSIGRSHVLISIM